MTDLYLWIKALHVIAVIAWMAGLLYLPRLFVYHARQTVGSAASETFKVMEQKLLRLIMNPAMIIAVLTGGLLVWLQSPGILSEGWLHGKLVLVGGLALVHHQQGRWRRTFADDRNTHSERFFRVQNEVPTLLMIGIVILVIVKPF